MSTADVTAPDLTRPDPTHPELTRIALVEDEPDIRELAVLALTEIGGLEARAYPSGTAALDGLPHYAPQLIVLDVMMPRMDGRTLRRKLAEHPVLASIPVAFMTAKSRRAEIAALTALGVVGVVRKPFDPLTLADELRALWAGVARSA